MNRKIPYVKQSPTGGLYDFTKKKFTKTYIPREVIGRRGNKNYIIWHSGCGLCATSMALSDCLGTFIDPKKLNACYRCGNGSLHKIGRYEASKRGIVTIVTNDIKVARQWLAIGCTAENIQGKGIFTKAGHYILLTGYKDGRYSVNDSASTSRTTRMSGRTYTESQIDRTTKKYGYGYTVFLPLPLHNVRRGDKGDDVTRWQIFLKWYYDLAFSFVDGKFGANTEKYTNKFRAEFKYKQDGIAGTVTRKQAIAKYSAEAKKQWEKVK